MNETTLASTIHIFWCGVDVTVVSTFAVPPLFPVQPSTPKALRPTMATTAEDLIRHHRFSVDEYQRMGDNGIFHEFDAPYS